MSSHPLWITPSVFILSTAKGQTLILFLLYESHVDYGHLSMTGFYIHEPNIHSTRVYAPFVFVL